MTRFNPAHINPPRETTPEEAERNKRAMTRDEADRRRKDDEDEPVPGSEKAVDSPDGSAAE